MIFMYETEGRTLKTSHVKLRYDLVVFVQFP